MSNINTDLIRTLTSIENSSVSLSDKESLVSSAYNTAFKSYFKLKDGDIIRVANCDAYFKCGKLVLLIEYKYDKNLDNTTSRAKVLAQIVFYYKKILQLSNKQILIPNVLFIGDVNECIALHVNHINKFLNVSGVNWNVSPSSAGEQLNLVNAIINDSSININSIVYNVASGNFTELCERMESLSNNTIRFVAITSETIQRAFDHFSTKILNKYSGKSNDVVGMFFDFIKNRQDVCIKNGEMYFKNFASVSINEIKAKQFMDVYFGELDENQKHELNRLYDQLVKNDERRRNGQFFTPQIWVNEAHTKITKILGDSWYNEAIVWDCCCGTKSLTRTFSIDNLYLSTLENSELASSEELNTEAKETFVFNFLNDSLTQLPKSLQSVLKKANNTPVVFLINPPYSQATSGMGNEHKAGTSDTEVLHDMKLNNCGKAGNELFCQFLWKIMEVVKRYNLKNVVVGTFSNPMWLCGDSYENFRKHWLNMFNYNEGFKFNASEFEGCSNNWGISFSTWTLGKNVNDFTHDIMENMDGISTNCIKTHTLYNLDGKTLASEWVRGKLPKTYKTFATTDGIKIIDKSDKSCRGATCDNALGYFASNGNTIDSNAQFVSLFSLPMSRAHGFNILPENFDKVCSLFAARALIMPNWINHNDSYSVPNESDPRYQEWQSDSYILSMFDNKSNQSSIKGEYNGNSYEYGNQFFPFSKSEVYNLLNIEKKQNFKEEVRYIRSSGKLDKITPEGEQVIKCFQNCIKASSIYRKEYSNNHIELQLSRWDSGYKQLKGLFNEYSKEEYILLKLAISKLQEKMRPLVYELTFLKK